MAIILFSPQPESHSDRRFAPPYEVAVVKRTLQGQRQREAIWNVAGADHVQRGPMLGKIPDRA
jgi:hypothetical protein